MRGIDSPILLLVVLLGLAALAALAVSGRRRAFAATRRAAGNPVCGACGYSTVGSVSLVCPECGNDLREVGIVAPHMLDIRGPGFWVSALIYTGTFIAIAAIYAGAVSEVAPRHIKFSSTTTVNNPKSGAYTGVDITANASSWNKLPPKVPVELALKSMPKAVPAPTLRVPLSKPSSGNADPRITLNRDQILAWMASAGIDVSDPLVRREAGRILGLAQDTSHVQSRRGSGIYTSTSSGSSEQFGSVFRNELTRANRIPGSEPVILVVVILIWMAGLVYLWRRTHALRA